MGAFLYEGDLHFIEHIKQMSRLQINSPKIREILTSYLTERGKLVYQDDYIKSIFDKNVSKYLRPTLIKLGFERYELHKGWIYPTYLYKHKKIQYWFGASYDWRDNYYEAKLGDLYRFKDVLPRLVILGIDLSSNNQRISDVQKIDEFIEKLLIKTKKSLEFFLTKEDSFLEQEVLRNIKNDKQRLANYIIEEVKYEDI